MAETLFPTRQRCKKCSKGLGAANAPVFLGLFCTPKCASMAPPATDPEHAPRECKTYRQSKWEFKRRYRSEQEMPKNLREDPTVSWYWGSSCCGSIHIGHSRLNLEKEQFRMFTDTKDVADFLVKSRGKATRKQVAEVAGILPIRLKELEEPGTAKRIDFDALFKVMALYQSRLGAGLKVKV